MAKRIVNVEYDPRWKTYKVVSTTNVIALEFMFEGGVWTYDLVTGSEIKRADLDRMIAHSHHVDNFTVNVK